MSELLGQTVVIENVSGAGGMTAASRVAHAPPDGYQFVLGSVDTFGINQSLYKKPLYNAATDFSPIGLVTDQAMVLIARKDFPANDMKEFIAYAKANHDKMQFASGGVGSGVAPDLRARSMPRSASTSRMSPIAARRRRCRICSPAASTTTARSPPPRSARWKASRPRPSRS